MSKPRTRQSDYLLALGRKILQPYTQLPNARAAMITGSAAEGVSDNYSDIDTTLYYEGALPTEAELAEIRIRNGAPERVWVIGDRAEENIAEAYEVEGIQIQIGHTTLAAWERDLEQVLEKFDTNTPLHKAMSGTLEAVTVYGDAYMTAWQHRIAAYPDGLRRAMVEQHLQFFPYWAIQAMLSRRDAVIWHYQLLVESCYNLLAILAGLNRLYFTTFQFKKMRRLIDQMKIAPPKLADRLEALFTLEPAAAVVELEALVGQVVALVERELPDVNVSAVKKSLGVRRQPWSEKTL